MNDKRFSLRLSQELFKLIEEEAEKNLRSINNEIVSLLMIGLVSDMNEREARDKAELLLKKQSGK